MPNSGRVGISRGCMAASIIPNLSEAPISEGGTMLLFGSSGFAGSHLREAAEAEGLALTACSRSGKNADMRCDLLEAGEVEQAVRAAGPQLIVNMAGWASVR